MRKFILDFRTVDFGRLQKKVSQIQKLEILKKKNDTMSASGTGFLRKC